jgi:hypothetical protein
VKKEENQAVNYNIFNEGLAPIKNTEVGYSTVSLGAVLRNQIKPKGCK